MTDLALLPSPLFPLILELLPLKTRLKLATVSKVWLLTLYKSITHICVVRNIYESSVTGFYGWHQRDTFDTQEELIASKASKEMLLGVASRFPYLHSLRLLVQTKAPDLAASLKACPPTLKVLRVSKCSHLNCHNQQDFWDSLSKSSFSLTSLCIRFPSYDPDFCRCQEGKDKRKHENEIFEREIALGRGRGRGRGRVGRIALDERILSCEKRFYNGFIGVLEKHGPTLRKLDFSHQHLSPKSFPEAIIDKIAALAPHLKQLSPDLMHDSIEDWCVFRNLEVLKFQGRISNINIEGFYSHHIRKFKSSNTPSVTSWKFLSDPRIQHLESLSVSSYWLADLSECDLDVFRNNPNLRKVSMRILAEQVESLAPYLRNLTRLEVFCRPDLKPDHWEILGKSLLSIQSLRIGGEQFCDVHLVGWSSGMPETLPSLKFLDLYDTTASPLKVAQLIAPKCPNLEYFSTAYSALWTDQTLLELAKFKTKLRSIRINGTIKPHTLTHFIRNCGSELVSFSLIKEWGRKLVTLNDFVIREITIHCTKLEVLKLPFVRGVSHKGWLQLRKLKPLNVINISSDTWTPDLQKELSRFQAPKQERKKLPSKVREKKAAKAEKNADRAKSIALSRLLLHESAARFLAERKAHILEQAGDDPTTIPFFAMQEIPPLNDEITDDHSLYTKIFWLEAHKLKGEELKKKYTKVTS